MAADAEPDRRPPARPRARDRRMGPGRGGRRPGAREPHGDAARGARRGAAGAASDPHPPRPRGRDRRACRAVPRSRGLGARPGGAAPGRPVPAAGSAERIYGDEMGPLWGRVVPVPERNLRVLEGGETIPSPGASSTSSTRPATPLTTSSTSTAPTARRTWATSRACGSRPPTSSARRRRRPTSTSRRGSARSTSSPARRPARLALTHFGMVDDPLPHLEQMAQRLREQAELVRDAARASTGTPSEAVAAFVEEVDRRTREAAGVETAAVFEVGRAGGAAVAGPAALLAEARRGRRGVMATETIEMPRVGGPGTGGGAWMVIVLNDNHNTFDHVAQHARASDPERDRRAGIPVRRRDPQQRAGRSCGPASASRPSSTGSS